jgi:hypothetical protein
MHVPVPVSSLGQACSHGSGRERDGVKAQGWPCMLCGVVGLGVEAC